MVQSIKSMFYITMICLLLCACKAHGNPRQPETSTVSSLSTSPSAETEFESNQYESHSMEEIIAGTRTIVNFDDIKQDPHDSIYLEMDIGHTFPSSVTMMYHGEFHEIPSHRMLAISAWLRSPRPSMSDEDVLTIFQYEGRFSEGPTSYWLPVQTSLILSMQEELRPGDKVNLYIRWIALTKVDQAIDYIFLVNAWFGPL